MRDATQFGRALNLAQPSIMAFFAKRAARGLIQLVAARIALSFQNETNAPPARNNPPLIIIGGVRSFREKAKLITC